MGIRTLLVCVVVSGLSSGEGPGLDRHRWLDARELRSRHYIVETNTFEEVAQSLSQRLEEAYILFQERFGVLHGAAARHMRVRLFRTSQEYMDLGGGVVGAIGHFDAAHDHCTLAWRRESDLAGWPIAVHEACHHYVRRRYPHITLPSWYAEGMACYFEGLQDRTSDGGVSRVRIRTARKALEAGEAKLDEVLFARARVVGGALRLDTFRPVRYYALAWSLVHFLATDARYRQGFRRFELRLFHSTKAKTRALLLEECGSLEEIEKGWHKHLRNLELPDPPTVPPVYAFELRSPRAWVRYAALERLAGTRPPPDLLEGVRACLDDCDLIVRTEATRLLAGDQSAGTVEAMTRALDLSDATLKAVALRALAHPGASAAVPRLLREEEDREAALRALAAIGDPRAEQVLREALLETGLDAATRARCARALGKSERDLPYLRVALDDVAPAVQTAARAAMLRLGHDRPRRELREYIDVDGLLRRAKDPAVAERSRAKSCALLGMAGTERAVPVLRRLCAPEHPEMVRLEAARALVAITGETRGFKPGQAVREREAALRRWATDS